MSEFQADSSSMPFSHAGNGRHFWWLSCLAGNASLAFQQSPLFHHVNHISCLIVTCSTACYGTKADFLRKITGSNTDTTWRKCSLGLKLWHLSGWTGIISGRKTDRGVSERVWAVTDGANFLACMLTTPTVSGGGRMVGLSRTLKQEISANNSLIHT